MVVGEDEGVGEQLRSRGTQRTRRGPPTHPSAALRPPHGAILAPCQLAPPHGMTIGLGRGGNGAVTARTSIIC